MTLSGKCECGAATYRVNHDALNVYACHCLNCHTRSGSAFAEHAMIPASAFAIEGRLSTYAREADGIAFEECVCGLCFTRLFNRNTALPDMIFLRAGTLDESSGLRPMAHIWVLRKQPWVRLPRMCRPSPDRRRRKSSARHRRSPRTTVRLTVGCG